jgi:hypothetical protein
VRSMIIYRSRRARNGGGVCVHSGGWRRFYNTLCR